MRGIIACKEAMSQSDKTVLPATDFSLYTS